MDQPYWNNRGENIIFQLFIYKNKCQNNNNNNNNVFMTVLRGRQTLSHHGNFMSCFISRLARYWLGRRVWIHRREN